MLFNYAIGTFYSIYLLTAVNHVDCTEVLVFPATEVFNLTFKEHVFKDWDFRNQSDIKYRAALESMPDLPEWIHYVHSDDGDGYLYGAPPDQREKLNIEIIATNTYNYETYRKVITIKVKDREHKAKNEVEIRFSNLNVEDMFKSNRSQRVKDIFMKSLWKDADVYLTLVASAVKMGGRLPPNPEDKEGVVVRLGSEANFSAELLNLEQEVIPLLVRVPCPKDYKRTSAERFFRDDDFIPDWCGFRLHYAQPKMKTDSSPKHSPIHLTSDDFRPPSLHEPHRDLTLDFVLSIVVPITVAVMLLIILSFFMCCYHEGIEKRNKDNPSIQMVQYASIHRASNNLRCLATKRDNPKTSNNTPASTLPRTYGNSANNTLTKTGTAKRGDTGVTKRPNLPPLYLPPT